MRYLKIVNVIALTLIVASCASYPVVVPVIVKDRPILPDFSDADVRCLDQDAYSAVADNVYKQEQYIDYLLETIKAHNQQ